MRLVRGADDKRSRSMPVATEQTDRAQEVFMPLLRVEVADADEHDVVLTKAVRAASGTAVDLPGLELVGVDRREERLQPLPESLRARMDVSDGAAGAHDDV